MSLLIKFQTIGFMLQDLYRWKKFRMDCIRGRLHITADITRHNKTIEKQSETYSTIQNHTKPTSVSAAYKGADTSIMLHSGLDVDKRLPASGREDTANISEHILTPNHADLRCTVPNTANKAEQLQEAQLLVDVLG